MIRVAPFRPVSLAKLSFGLAALALSFGLAPRANAQDATSAMVGGVGVKPLITSTVDDTKLAPASKLLVPEVKTSKDLGALAPDTAMYMEMDLRRSPEQEQAIHLLVQRSMDPRDAYFGKTLTPAEAAKTFGLAESDLATLKGWLEEKGFTVDTVDNGRLTLGFRGTAAQVQTAFHTELHSFEGKDGLAHFAPVTTPQIPKALVPVFGRIEGLSSFAPFEHQGFSGPVTDFLPGTKAAAVKASTEGDDAKTILAGEGLRDASFTLDKYSMIFGKGSFTANVRLNGLNYAPTGSLTFVDAKYGVIARIADVSKCAAYGSYGRNCSITVSPSKAGLYAVTAKYSGDEHTRAENLRIVANANGTGVAGIGEVSSSTTSYSTAGAGAAIADTYTAVLTYTGVAPSASDTITFAYNGGNTIATVALSACTANATNFTYTCTATDSAVSTNSPYYGLDQSVATFSGDTLYASVLAYADVYEERHAATVVPTATVTSSATGAYGVAATVPLSYAFSATGGSNTCGTTGVPSYYIIDGATGTGTVANGTLLGSAQLTLAGACTLSGTTYSVSGTANLTAPALVPPGTYNVSNRYSGNAGVNTYLVEGATATGTSTFTVSKGAVTLQAPTASPTSVITGASTAVTISGTITFPGVDPTGAVTFAVTNSGGTAITGSPFTSTCVAGFSPETCTATIPAATTAGLSAGAYTITPSFAGDNFYNSLTGTSTGTFTVANDSSSLTAAPTSEVYGSNGTVTLTDTITFSTSTPTPTGTVTFTLSSGVTAIGSVNLTACTVTSATVRTCSFVWTPPAGASGDNAGSYTVTAAYAGNYNNSTATTPFTITKAATTLTVTASPNYVTSASVNTTLTAVLSWSGVGLAPTGSISFACVAGTNGCSTNPTTLTINSTNCPGYTTTASSPITCTESYDAYDGSSLFGTISVAGTYGGDSNYGTSTGTSGTIDVTRNIASTTTATVTSGSPEAYGTSGTVVFSVVITGVTGDGAPTGTLVLTNTTLGTLATVTANGTNCTATNAYTYTCPISYVVPAATAVGAYSVTVTYNSTSSYYNNSSGTTSFTVAKQTPTVAVTNVNPASIQYGSGTTSAVTATLTYTGSGTAPTGGLTFSSTAAGSFTAPSCGTPSGDVITCTATFLPQATAAVGTYNIVASYAGDTNYAGPINSSQTGNYSVIRNTSTSISTITTTPTSVFPASTATVSATLTYTGTGAAPGSGNSLITFSSTGASFSGEACTYNTNSVTCTATLTPTVTDTPGTTYAVSAAYTATTNYAAASYTSTSTANGSFIYAAATVSLSTPTSTNNPSYYNQSTTFSTTQTYVGTAAPSSTVAFLFYQGGTLVKTLAATCTGTGSRTCTASYALLPAGTYKVYAYEAADSTNGYAAYTSAALTQTVNKQTPSSVTVSASPSSVAYGGTETFSSTVTFASDADGAAAPTGTVYFYVDGSTGANAQCTLSAVTATTSSCSVNYTANNNPGSHTVTSTYLGDSNYNTNGGTGGTYTTTAITQTLTLTGNANGTATTGTTSDTLTATLSPAQSGVTVAFLNASTGAVTSVTTNASGVATLTVTSTDGVTPAGYNSYSASVAASTDYSGASSGSVAVYVQGLLVSIDLKHNFSTDPGTVDGSPVCNQGGTNGTPGYTCTSGFSVVVTNFSTAANPFSLSFSNSAASAFSYTTNCPATMAANQQCNVNFYYLPPYGDGNNTASSSACSSSPSTCGAYEQGTWLVGSSTSGGGINTGVGLYSSSTGVSTSRYGVNSTAVLAGKALLPASAPISVTPTSLTFGPEAIGEQSGSQNVTVTNTSSSSIALTYNSPTSNAFLVSNACPSTLAGGASCQISIAFDNSSGGTVTDSFVIIPAAQTSLATSVSLTGTASNPSGITLSTNNHNFGTVATGTTNSFGLTVTNSSSSSQTISFSNAPGTGYTVTSSGCPASLAAGASCTVNVTYAPTAAGSSTDTLTITSSAPILPGGTTSSPYTAPVTFSGTATANAAFTISTYIHNFGTTPVGSAASNYGVTLTNTTGGTLTLAFGTLTGNDGFSTVNNACGATLATNASCNVTFGFTPTATGYVTDSRSISATDAGSNPVTLYYGYGTANQASVTAIQLRGTGQ